MHFIVGIDDDDVADDVAVDEADASVADADVDSVVLVAGIDCDDDDDGNTISSSSNVLLVTDLSFCRTNITCLKKFTGGTL